MNLSIHVQSSLCKLNCWGDPFETILLPFLCGDNTQQGRWGTDCSFSGLFCLLSGFRLKRLTARVTVCHNLLMTRTHCILSYSVDFIPVCIFSNTFRELRIFSMNDTKKAALLLFILNVWVCQRDIEILSHRHTRCSCMLPERLKGGVHPF